jgi:hypothetical protein
LNVGGCSLAGRTAARDAPPAAALVVSTLAAAMAHTSTMAAAIPVLLARRCGVRRFMDRILLLDPFTHPASGELGDCYRSQI